MEHYPFTIFIFGVAISSSAVMLGIGGGIVWSPVLILVYNIPPGQAIVTALAIQMGGMGCGAVSYYRSGRVDVKTGALYTLLALPMVVFGSIVGYMLSGTVLRIALGVVSIGLALFFISGEDWYREQEVRRIGMRQALSIGYIPFFLSFLSGLLSIGVGDFIVPALVKKLNFSMETAVGTALMVMSIIVTVGLVSHLMLGESISLTVICWAIPGVIIGAGVGSRLSRVMGGDILREIFIFIMLFIGIHMIYSSV